MATWKDRELAMRLGIPMYGADPKHSYLGTKSEGRRLFSKAGVAHPAGREDLNTVDDVVDAIGELRRANPHLRRVVVKHNEGVGGYGNAVVDLDDLPAPTSSSTESELRRHLADLDVQGPGATVESYYQVLAQEGGIVEEMVEGSDKVTMAVSSGENAASWTWLPMSWSKHGLSGSSRFRTCTRPPETVRRRRRSADKRGMKSSPGNA